MGAQEPRIIREAEGTPLVDVPSSDDITLSGDTLELAKSMTQVERDAMLIGVYRYTQEIAGFIRGLENGLNAAAGAPGIAGMMARNFGNGFGGGN